MRVARSAALGALFVACFTAALGCRKKVDPSAFDAGVTADTSAAASASATPADDAADAAAPLASLAPPKVPTAAPHHSTAPKAQPPECAAAARFCNHPAAGKDKAIQALCDQNKAACTSKGGHFP